MKDYRVTVVVKNNYLLTRMRERGFLTNTSLAKKAHVSSVDVGEYLNLARTPKDTKGEWRPSIVRIAQVLRCGPEKLFPPQHLETPLRKNRSSFEADLEEVARLTEASREQIALPSPDSLAIANETKEKIRAALEVLTPAQREVIEARFGFSHESMTQAEIARRAGVTSPRIGQIEHKALRRLRYAFRDHRNGKELLEEIAQGGEK